MSPLDPLHLTPTISLNRVRVLDLPGVIVDAEARGHTGYELLSAAALAATIRQHAPALGLDPDQDDHTLRLVLNDCLNSSEVTVRQAAGEVARRIGRNLGFVLLVLRRGDAVSRVARGEWDDSYWAHWAAIRQVWLGGGLVSGALGLALCAHARSVWAEAGISGYTIRLSPYGADLPLIGAARGAPFGCATALVFDFGTTRIKRGLAFYRDGMLVSVRRLDPLPSIGVLPAASGDRGASGARVQEFMLAAITATWRAGLTGGLRPDSPILASLAAYVSEGQPLDGQSGLYYDLRHITDNAQGMLSEALGKALEVPPPYVRLLHDGTAAAAAHAGAARTAVIMIGTALGIGFPPPAEGVRPLADDLVIE